MRSVYCHTHDEIVTRKCRRPVNSNGDAAEDGAPRLALKAHRVPQRAASVASTCLPPVEAALCPTHRNVRISIRYYRYLAHMCLLAYCGKCAVITRDGRREAASRAPAAGAATVAAENSRHLLAAIKTAHMLQPRLCRCLLPHAVRGPCHEYNSDLTTRNLSRHLTRRAEGREPAAMSILVRS